MFLVHDPLFMNVWQTACYLDLTVREAYQVFVAYEFVLDRLDE